MLQTTLLTKVASGGVVAVKGSAVPSSREHAPVGDAWTDASGMGEHMDVATRRMIGKLAEARLSFRTG